MNGGIFLAYLAMLTEYVVYFIPKIVSLCLVLLVIYIVLCALESHSKR